MISIRLTLLTLANNVKLLSSNGNKMIAVVKNDFYGLGIENIIHIDEYIDMYAVNNIVEARRVEEFTDKAVIILEPVAGNNIPTGGNFIYLVSSLTQLEQYNCLAFNINIALKINTGLNRYGIDMVDIPEFLDVCKSNINITDIMTHTYGAKSYLDVSTKFNYALDLIKDKISLDNVRIHMHDTSFLLNVQDNPNNKLVCTHNRTGMGILGLVPVETSNTLGIKLPIKINIVVNDKRHVPRGVKIGYNNKPTKKDLFLITLPIGYCSGMNKNLVGKILTLNSIKFKVKTIMMDNTILSVNEKFYNEIEILKTNISLIDSFKDIAEMADKAETSVEDIFYNIIKK